jgi:hypothetical protein
MVDMKVQFEWILYDIENAKKKRLAQFQKKKYAVKAKRQLEKAGRSVIIIKTRTYRYY